MYCFIYPERSITCNYDLLEFWEPLFSVPTKFGFRIRTDFHDLDAG